MAEVPDDADAGREPSPVVFQPSTSDESSAAAFLAGVKYAGRGAARQKREKEASDGMQEEEAGDGAPASSDADTAHAASVLAHVRGALEAHDADVDCGKGETPDGTMPPAKPRRTRQSFSWRQVAVLEQVFEQDPMPPQLLRVQLAERLGVQPRTVQVWFQNRRQKQKQLQQAMGQNPPSFRASHSRLVSLPQLQHGVDSFAVPQSSGVPVATEYMPAPGAAMVAAPLGQYMYAAYPQAQGSIVTPPQNSYLQPQVGPSQLRSVNETAAETVDHATAAVAAAVAAATASVMVGAAAPPSKGGAPLPAVPMPGYASMQYYSQLLQHHPHHTASVQAAQYAAQQAAHAAGGSFVPGPSSQPLGYMTVSNGPGMDHSFGARGAQMDSPMVPVPVSQLTNPPIVSMAIPLAPGQPQSRPSPPGQIQVYGTAFTQLLTAANARGPPQGGRPTMLHSVTTVNPPPFMDAPGMHLPAAVP